MQQPEIHNGKVSPRAIEVEKEVLGSCLIEADAAYTAFEMLQPDDFYKSAHQHIFKTLLQMFDQSKDFSLLGVETELRNKGLLETCGGSGYLSELTRSVSSAANVDYHAQIIREKAKKRDLITGCSEIIKRAYDSSEDTYDVLDFADRKIFEIINDVIVSNTHEPREVIESALEYILKKQESKDGVTGIPTGLDIDNLTAGWQDSNLIIFAGRPSMGKTAFLLHCLKATPGYSALCSLETSHTLIGNRLIVTEAGIDGQKARKGQLSEKEISACHEAANRLLETSIIVDDTTSLSPSQLRAKGKALKNKYDIKMLAVDFLQLMMSSEDRRERQIAEASRSCKLLCKELDIPVIALSQLSRSCEGRHGINKRPQLSDLRESGAIEQDADVVISLFRPEYYGIDKYPDTEGDKWAGESTENICELIVNKQKDGPTGSVRQIFNKEHMKFSNYTSQQTKSYMPGSMTSDNSPF